MERQILRELTKKNLESQVRKLKILKKIQAINSEKLETEKKTELYEDFYHYFNLNMFIFMQLLINWFIIISTLLRINPQEHIHDEAFDRDI